MSAVVAVGATVALAVAIGTRGQSPQAAAQRHFYVSPTGSDRASGSHAHPWRTIGYAGRHVGAGSTVHVAPGRYRGPVIIERGGTSSRPFRFVSDRRWRARVMGSSDDSIAIVEIRGDYVRFEGFEVSGRGGDGSAAIDLEGSSDAAVGNRVRGLDAPCPDSGNGAAGILVGGGSGGYRNS